jgi:hypothetical protein
MLKEDIEVIHSLVKEYGVKEAMRGFIEAIIRESNDLSDMGIKERAIQAITLAEVLKDIIGE